MGHALHVPALGQHVHAHDGAHVLAGLALGAHGVDHLAQHGFVALVGVEDLGVHLNSHPARPVLVVGVAQQLVLARQVLEEPGRALGAVGHTEQHWRRPARELERAGPLVVVLLP
jgi:hypothetical protein